VRILGLVLLAFLIVGCGETSERPDAPGSDTPSRTPKNSEMETAAEATESASKLRKVIINASSGEKVKVRVEIADDYREIVIGLRWRKSLPENRGMLFVHTEEEQRTFTMEDTLIPLSIAFMDSEGRIVDIQNMEPSKEGYVSSEPAQYALEVNQGFFDEHGIEVGDRAELPV
jgi:uncharacterized membrane protein (UPF0127 family)